MYMQFQFGAWGRGLKLALLIEGPNIHAVSVWSLGRGLNWHTVGLNT